MPIYEYVCTGCNYEIEAIQKMSDDALVFCPECSNGTLKKKISAVAFQLKGTGWYETDFKDNKPKSGAEDKSSAKQEASSENKSAKSSSDSSNSDKGSSSKQASAA